MGAGEHQPEIYIECMTHGGLMKVTAIDGATGTEVSVFGPASANSREALTRTAVAKLAYVLKKDNPQ
jgi:hypothetical protein